MEELDAIVEKIEEHLLVANSDLESCPKFCKL